MKKVILLAFLMGVFVFMWFVVAESGRMNSSVHLNKGWNLVSGLIGREIILQGDISKDNLEAIYAFIPQVQTYIRIYPNPETDKLRSLGDVDDYIKYSALWVYSNKEGVLNYKPVDSLALKDNPLFTGWNFVAITYDMLGNGGYPRLRDLAGTCNIQKAYFFNPEEQNWNTFPMDEDFSSDALNTGIVIQVSNDCKLGTSVADVPSVPNLP